MYLVLTLFTTLFSVVNPLGAMPVFLALTGTDTDQERNQQAIKACLIAACILIVSFLIGTYILKFFQISIEGMRIAAGFLLMQTGFGLLNAPYRKNKSIDGKIEKEATDKEDISFFPLALPMLSGPGSISLLISIASELDYSQYIWVILAIALTCLASFVILFLSPKLSIFLGRSGIRALSKLMGFIVLTVGIQYVINGSLPLMEELLLKIK